MAVSEISRYGTYIPAAQDPTLEQIRLRLAPPEENIFDASFEDEATDLFNLINQYFNSLGFKPIDKTFRLQFNPFNEENYQNLIFTIIIQNTNELLKSRIRPINFQPFEFDSHLDSLARATQSSLKDLLTILKKDPISHADLKRCFNDLDINITNFEKLYYDEMLRFLNTGREIFYKTHELESKIENSPLDQQNAEKNFLKQLDKLYALRHKDPIWPKLQQIIRQNPLPPSIEAAYKELRKVIAATCAKEHPFFVYINENIALCAALDALEKTINDYQSYQQCCQT